MRWEKETTSKQTLIQAVMSWHEKSIGWYRAVVGGGRVGNHTTLHKLVKEGSLISEETIC